jgi:hypothetical protein
MLNRKKAKVIQITSERPGAAELLIEISGRREKAMCFPDLTGSVSPGDEVLLNTTAVDLALGTGGVHFVMCNLSNPAQPAEPSDGHIMKLRYTPLQEALHCIEEDDIKDRVQEFKSLDGMPVVCCEIHSQIAPVAAAIRAANPQTRIAYIMTDGAALPIGFSRLVAELKSKRLIDITITCGQAFGGDMEAINVYSATIAAKEVARADVAIICQGPGNAGAATKYGFSGIQQGDALNAVSMLGGTPIMVLRMSFEDPRERHHGMSHHSRTILERIALRPVVIALPKLPDGKAFFVQEQMELLLQETKHQVRRVDAETGLQELERQGIQVTTMGRTVEEDREFFLAGSAAGVVAAELLQGK